MSKPAIDSKDPNFQMSQEEVKAFENAMKKPEFVDLLSEYMTEISDPKNRAEYDEYLKQLEREQELPKGMKLLKPNPCFCIKTSLKGKKEANFTTKLFINLCSTDELQRPTFATGSQAGQQGQNWKLPYITNKPRYDQDKEKNVCTTIDVAFHPYAFDLIGRNPLFEKLLCNTAIDSTEKQLLERNEVVSRDYKILKKIKCKGGEPATMTIRGSRLKEDPAKKQDDFNDKRQKDGDYGPKLYKEFIDKQREGKDKRNEEKDKKEEFDDKEEGEGIKIEELDETHEIKGVERPKYQVFYTYESEYFDFIEKREEKFRKRPKNMRIEVLLSKLRPKIDNIGDMKLDINENNMILDIPKKYYLDMKLGYPVIKEQGNAKYDPKTKKLKIALTIDQTKLTETHLKEIEKIEEFNKNQENNQNMNEDNENIEKKSENQEFSKNLENIEKIEKLPENLENLEKITKLEENDENSEVLQENNDNLLEFHEKTDFLKISKQSPKKTENLDHPLIEELIEPSSLKPEENPSKIENKLKLALKLDFKTQENSEKYFLIINIPGYVKENCEFRKNVQQLLFLYENEEKMLYFWVQMNEDLIIETCEFSYVVDYIVVNFTKRKENMFLEKKYGENLTGEYCDFLEKFKEIQVISEEKIKNHEKTEEISKNEEISKKEEISEDIAKNEEISKNDEISKKEEEEIKQENILEKHQIQFINYNFPFIYELD